MTSVLQCRGRLGFGVTDGVFLEENVLVFRQECGATVWIDNITPILTGQCVDLTLRKQYLAPECTSATICLVRQSNCIRVDSPDWLPFWAEIPLY